MSIFASETQATIPIPFDPPHTVTIRRLTGAEVERAQSEHLKSIINGRSSRGWSRVFQRALVKGASEADAEAALRDPLNGYDRAVIVEAGLLAWSYGEVTPERRADLDDEALEFLAHEILRLTKPALFQTADEIEAAQVKG